MVTTVEITDKIKSQINDEYYIKSIRLIHDNLEECVGPFRRWGEYPILSWGEGWMITVSEPNEFQRYYLTIDSEILATTYILKYS